MRWIHIPQSAQKTGYKYINIIIASAHNNDGSDVSFLLLFYWKSFAAKRVAMIRRHDWLGKCRGRLKCNTATETATDSVDTDSGCEHGLPSYRSDSSLLVLSFYNKPLHNLYLFSWGRHALDLSYLSLKSFKSYVAKYTVTPLKALQRINL